MRLRSGPLPGPSGITPIAASLSRDRHPVCLHKAFSSRCVSVPKSPSSQEDTGHWVQAHPVKYGCILI